jgi:hypothetical protein
MTINNTNINFETLESIATTAIETLTASNRNDKTRWINAIKKAVIELQENPFWSFDGQQLLMMSTTSNTTYQSNGVCQCRAFEQSQPCRHRAGFKILLNYSQTA